MSAPLLQAIPVPVAPAPDRPGLLIPVNSRRAQVMASILIRCPTFHWAVPTGLTTDIIKLDTLEIPLTMRCAVCRQIHQWEQKDAWIEEEKQDE